MAPLLILICILVGLMGNAWLLSGMPVIKPFGILLAACFISWFYFAFGLPILLTVLARKFRQSRKLTTSLLCTVIMVLTFYASAILTWILISRGWSLSFLTTLKAAGDSENFGSLEDAAEHLLVCFLAVSTLATVAAGMLTTAMRKLWIRHHAIAA